MVDQPPAGLDDPDYAAFAWGRYRRIMRWMTLVAALLAGGAVAILWWWLGEMPLHMGIATALGVGLSILLAAALMGLMFLSSGTGHDNTIIEWSREEDDER